jgi:Xaa-Pro dipeptidase
VGGVRIEDVFRVTDDGYEILSDCPRTTEEVEACMKGEDWRALACRK